MKSFIKWVYKIVRGFIERLEEDHVNAYAAQSSFFVVISAFPLIMLIFNLIKYTPVTKDFLLKSTESILPKTLEPIAESLVLEMYENTSGTAISITALLTLWSASKGVMAIIKGLNNIFKTDEDRGYFKLRLISSIYTVLFVVGIVLSLVMLVFGNSLLKLCENHMPLLYDVVEWIMGMRILYVPVILTVLFVGLYKLVNDKNHSFISHIPGAMFSAIGWMGFSYFYSLYVDNFAGKSYAYGSLTTMVLMMLWIYICMYILFIGAEITVYFRKYLLFLQRVIKHRREMKAIEAEKTQKNKKS